MERYRIDLRLFEPDTQAHEKSSACAGSRRAVRPESVAGVAGPAGDELHHEKAAARGPRPTEEDQAKTHCRSHASARKHGPGKSRGLSREYDELEER